MVDISVITFTLGGRDEYLKKCTVSVAEDLLNSDSKIIIEHHLIFQGCKKPQFIYDIIANESSVAGYKIYCHEWPTNIGIGAGLNKILPECKGELIFKMDDDCEIVSKDFFGRAYALHKRFPDAVFSPYPTGLINNPGGPRGFKHSVYHDKVNDKIYTRRHVSHLGGFARFSPAHIIKNFQFPNDLMPGISGSEDGHFSNYCNSNGIEMFYLENSMVVEHLESTLGQVVRYPEYFINRNSESKLKIEVVE